MKALTIGRAARLAGVGVETIRFYERQGLLEQPPRPQSGVRRYSDEVIARIRFIKKAQQLGFTLRETQELLALRADPEADCSDLRAQAATKLEDVRYKIAQLQQIGAALQALIDACPGRGGLEVCSILEALTLDSDNGADLAKISESVATRPARRSAR
jgi:MerR family mercuric resistance operon transcriptional regulator